MRALLALSLVLAVATPAGAWTAPGRLAWPAGDAGFAEEQPFSRAGELPDGSLLVASSSRGRIELRHLLADGTEDAAYGVPHLLLPASTQSASIAAVLPQASGRVIVVVSLSQRFTASGLVIAISPDGTPDRTYGDEGEVHVPLAGVRAAPAPGDGVVMTGVAKDRWVVARLTPDGAPDPTLDGDGAIPVPGVGGGDPSGNGVSVLSDGRIVLLGVTGRATTRLTRLLPDGSPDPDFNGGRPLLPHIAYAGALTTLSDGTAAIAGTDTIARVTSGGHLDARFGSHGRVGTAPSGNGGRWNLVLVGDAIEAWRARGSPPLPSSRPLLDVRAVGPEGLGPARPLRLPLAGGYVSGGAQDSFEIGQLLPRSGGGWLAVGSTSIAEAFGHDTGFVETSSFQIAVAGVTAGLGLDEGFGAVSTDLRCHVAGARLTNDAPPYHSRLRMRVDSTLPGIGDLVVRTSGGRGVIDDQVPVFVSGPSAVRPSYLTATAVDRLRRGDSIRASLRIRDVLGRTARCSAALVLLAG